MIAENVQLRRRLDTLSLSHSYRVNTPPGSRGAGRQPRTISPSKPYRSVSPIMHRRSWRPVVVVASAEKKRSKRGKKKRAGSVPVQLRYQHQQLAPPPPPPISQAYSAKSSVSMGPKKPHFHWPVCFRSLALSLSLSRSLYSSRNSHCDFLYPSLCVCVYVCVCVLVL